MLPLVTGVVLVLVDVCGVCNETRVEIPPMAEILMFCKEYDNSLRSVAIDELGLSSMQLVTDAKVGCRPWYTARYVRLFRIVQCFRAFFIETEPISMTLRIDDSSHS
jgi:hypothetical protein